MLSGELQKARASLTAPQTEEQLIMVLASAWIPHVDPHTRRGCRVSS